MNTTDFDQALVTFIANKVSPRIGLGGSVLLGILYKSKICALHEGMRMLGIEDAMGVVDLAKLREGLDGTLMFVQTPFKEIFGTYLEDAKQFLIALEKKAQ